MTVTVDQSVGLWRNASHHYAWNGGPWMPGVTAVIKAGVDKSGVLTRWAQGVTADAAIANVDRLRSMLDEFGPVPTKAWLTQQSYEQGDKAAKLGVQIHDLTEQYDRGQTPDVAPELLPALQAYHRFKEDWKPNFRSRERYVANLTHSYAGTFDSLVEFMDGDRCRVCGKEGPSVEHLVCLDLKSGKGTYPEGRLQLAALMRGEFIGLPGDPKKYAFKAAHGAILHVRPDAYQRGYQLFRVDVNESDWAAFLGALAVYRWSSARPSKGEPMLNGVKP